MERIASYFRYMGLKKGICLIIIGCWGGLLAGSIAGCASSPKEKKLSKAERARMLVQIANGAVLENDPTGALQNLADAEVLDDELPELYHTRALAFFAKREYGPAITAAKRAVQLKSDYAEANNTLGKLLMDVGQFEEAIGPLTLAANNSLYRDSYKAWTNLGILNYQKGDLGQSEVFLDKATKAAPKGSCIAHYYLGQIKSKGTRLDEAIQDYSFATKSKCARFGEAYLGLGLAYQKSKKYDEARKTFLEIQKLYPNSKLAEKALMQLRYLP